MQEQAESNRYAAANARVSGEVKASERGIEASQNANANADNGEGNKPWYKFWE